MSEVLIGIDPGTPLVTAEWRPIPGLAPYEVSSSGSVRSPGRWGRGQLVRPINHRSGYLYVGLVVEGVQRKFYVHRLVLGAFVGDPPEGCEGSHQDGDRRNNRLENLRWESPSENNQHKVRHGTAQRGSRCGTAILTEDEVREIRSAYAARGVTQRALADRFGCSQRQILSIIKGASWKHIV